MSRRCARVLTGVRVSANRSQYQSIAIIQLVSGILNVVAIPYLIFVGLGAFGGAVTAFCTMGLCPIGVGCGIPPLLLVPLGILEVVSGIVLLALEEPKPSFARSIAIVEIFSVLVGGLLSAVAGVVVLLLLAGIDKKPEIY